MAAKPVCSVDMCDKAASRRGMCYPHFYRLRRYGDVSGGRRLCGAARTFADDLVSRPWPDDCVIWPYLRDQDGVGQFRLNGKTIRATHYICEHAHGARPTPKHEIAHGCGQGHNGCVNPLHLRWATHADNIADKAIHGTLPRGEANNCAKLTEDDVRWIVQMKGQVATSEMARRLGVAQVTVQSILCGRNWGWLTKIEQTRLRRRARRP